MTIEVETLQAILNDTGEVIWASGVGADDYVAPMIETKYFTEKDSRRISHCTVSDGFTFLGYDESSNHCVKYDNFEIRVIYVEIPKFPALLKNNPNKLPADDCEVIFKERSMEVEWSKSPKWANCVISIDDLFVYANFIEGLLLKSDGKPFLQYWNVHELKPQLIINLYDYDDEKRESILEKLNPK